VFSGHAWLNMVIEFGTAVYRIAGKFMQQEAQLKQGLADCTAP